MCATCNRCRVRRITLSGNPAETADYLQDVAGKPKSVHLQTKIPAQVIQVPTRQALASEHPWKKIIALGEAYNEEDKSFFWLYRRREIHAQ